MTGETGFNFVPEEASQPELSREDFMHKIEEMAGDEFSQAEIIEEAIRFEPKPDPTDDEAVMAYAEKMAYLRDLSQSSLGKAQLVHELNNWLSGRRVADKP